MIYTMGRLFNAHTEVKALPQLTATVSLYSQQGQIYTNLEQMISFVYDDSSNSFQIRGVIFLTAFVGFL